MKSIGNSWKNEMGNVKISDSIVALASWHVYDVDIF